MNVTLCGNEKVRIYGNCQINEIWQDIKFELTTESLMMPMYSWFSDFKPFIYEQKHDNGYSSGGIILIKTNEIEARLEELKTMNIEVKEIGFDFK